MELNFNKINLEKVKGDINLFIFNNNLGGIKEMQETNKLIEVLKNVKIEINNI